MGLCTALIHASYFLWRQQHFKFPPLKSGEALRVPASRQTAAGLRRHAAPVAVCCLLCSHARLEALAIAFGAL